MLKVLEAGDGFADRVHASGVLLGVWIADDPETARRLFELGVDAVATNDPRAIVLARDAVQARVTRARGPTFPAPSTANTETEIGRPGRDPHTVTDVPGPA